MLWARLAPSGAEALSPQQYLKSVCGGGGGGEVPDRLAFQKLCPELSRKKR